MAKTFKFYLTATEKDGKNYKVKTSVLLTYIGQSCREIYETFSFDNPGDEKNITILRQKVSTYRQHEEQNFHDFVTELKTFSSGCECEKSP